MAGLWAGERLHALKAGVHTGSNTVTLCERQKSPKPRAMEEVVSHVSTPPFFFFFFSFAPSEGQVRFLNRPEERMSETRRVHKHSAQRAGV